MQKHVNKYYKLFFTSILFLILEAFCDLMLPTIMADMVDVGVMNHDLVYVLARGRFMFLVVGIGAAGAVVRNHISNRVSNRVGRDIRDDLFTRIQSLSYETVSKFDTASLSTRLTNDVVQIQNFVHGLMRMFIKVPLLFFGSIVMSIILEPRLAWIIMAVIPTVFILIFFTVRISFPRYRKVQTAIDQLSGVVREYLSGVRVVKAFNRFNFEEERFAGPNEYFAKTLTRALKTTAFFSPLTIVAVNFGIIMVLWFGGISVDSGTIQVGKIMAFLNYMAQMIVSLRLVSRVLNLYVRARAANERISEVMDIREETRESRDLRLETGKADVRFHEVSFSYAGGMDKAVLRNVSFYCEKGSVTGIIGPTGSGKSTLANLIPRFYDAAKGSVFIGGVDVRDMDEHALREMIAVVPQKNVLFTGTVIDNIRWGRKDSSVEEVKEAAAVAQAHGFIEAMPEGYDTVLAQGGKNLSGGQRQRLAIARALVRKPEILILDDCTSSVDVITEAKIRKGIKEYAKDMIVIIISQRVSSVMDSDRILILENGEAAGYGGHEELMESCGVYREIFNSQFGKEA